MRVADSKFYKTSLYDGLEALDATAHKVSFPFHFHPTFNISLVYDGTFQSRLKDKFVSATPGTILITNPQEIHANPFDNGNTVSFFTFYLSPDFLFHHNHGNLVVFKDHVLNDARLFADLQNLADLIRNGETGINFEQHLAKSLKLLAANHATDKPEEDGDDIILFQEYLAEENDVKFSLTEIANRFGIDKYKFLRLFKSQTGLSPNNYFILKRIEKSKKLLTEGAELLPVAIDLGFYDVAHFCNQFKKFTGISPIAYKSGT